MKLYKVVVIIPVYRVEKYVSACVESVLDQSYKNIEIILVDDGSPDKSPEICDDFAKRYDNVYVIHKENGGLSSARNAGLDYVGNKADYVVFLDSDDRLQVDSIEKMINMAWLNDAQVVLSDRYIKVNENNGREQLCFHFPPSYYTDSPKDFALNVIMGAGRAWRATAVLYSLDVINKFKIRFPLGMISEDVVFNLKVFQHITRMKIIQLPSLLNLQRFGSLSRSFQPHFLIDIFHIDDEARDFIVQTGQKYLNKYADALLARNAIVYLFSIFSKKNKTLNSEEKINLANDLINNERISKVIYKKYPMPYFDGNMAKIAYFVAKILVRLRMKRIAYELMKLR